MGVAGLVDDICVASLTKKNILDEWFNCLALQILANSLRPSDRQRKQQCGRNIIPSIFPSVVCQILHSGSNYPDVVWPEM